MNVPAGRSSGFTLIEVLVALVILAAGVVAVLRVFETSAVALAESRNRAWSALLIGEKLADIDAFIEENPGSAPVGGSGRFAGAYESFVWTVTVDESPAALAGLHGDCEDVQPFLVTVRVGRGDGGADYAASTLVRPRPRQDGHP